MENTQNLGFLLVVEEGIWVLKFECNGHISCRIFGGIVMTHLPLTAHVIYLVKI